MTTVALDSLADARPGSYWHDLHALAPVTTPLRHPTTADLVVVGAGFTGLWTAVTAKLRSPDRDVVLLDAEHVGFGATGRNGGFISDSVTHGLAHGLARWPDQIATLLEVGRDNLSGLVDDLHAAGIAPDLSLVGKTIVATTSHQAASLPALADLLAGHGEDAELLDADGVRADVDSPTYLGGIRVRTGGGVMDPVALAVGLRDWALRLGVRMHEQTPVVRVEGTHVVTPLALVRARQVVVATNAFRNPVRRLRKYVVPVYDHVLVTEPLSAGQWAALGWRDRQGLTDAGNQFHYYRPLADGRILWGGYDAIYYYGSPHGRDAGAARLLAPAAGRALPQTFPQLEGLVHPPLGGAHRHLEPLHAVRRRRPLAARSPTRSDSPASASPTAGWPRRRCWTRLDGRPVPAFVSERPVPFPPEPVRYLGVQTTRAALAPRTNRSTGAVAADPRPARRRLQLLTGNPMSGPMLGTYIDGNAPRQVPAGPVRPRRPGDRGGDRDLHPGSAADVDGPSAPRGRLPCLGSPDPRGPGDGAGRRRRRARGGRRPRRPGSARDGQAPTGVRRRRAALRARQPALLRRCGEVSRRDRGRSADLRLHLPRWSSGRSAWWPASPRGTSRSSWPSGRLGPALAAGNTMVLKPAPGTPARR